MNFKTAALLLSLCVAQPLFAHGGASPKHGGIVATAHDLDFELVVAGEDAHLYLQDHGKALAATGFSGKLSVLQGGASSEHALTASAARLEAKGAKLAKGATVVAVITLPSQKTVTVRFTLK